MDISILSLAKILVDRNVIVYNGPFINYKGFAFNLSNMMFETPSQDVSIYPWELQVLALVKYGDRCYWAWARDPPSDIKSRFEPAAFKTMNELSHLSSRPIYFNDPAVVNLMGHRAREMGFRYISMIQIDDTCVVIGYDTALVFHPAEKK